MYDHMFLLFFAATYAHTLIPLSQNTDPWLWYNVFKAHAGDATCTCTYCIFFKQVAETQLSGMPLDFRDRWILPLSVAWGREAKVAQAQAKIRTWVRRGRLTTRPTLCPLSQTSPLETWKSININIKLQFCTPVVHQVKDLGRYFWRSNTCISSKIDILLSFFWYDKILREMLHNILFASVTTYHHIIDVWRKAAHEAVTKFSKSDIL